LTDFHVTWLGLAVPRLNEIRVQLQVQGHDDIGRLQFNFTFTVAPRRFRLLLLLLLLQTGTCYLRLHHQGRIT